MNKNTDTTSQEFWRRGTSPPPEPQIDEDEVQFAEDDTEDNDEVQKTLPETAQDGAQTLRDKFFALPDGLFRVALQQLLVALAAVVVGFIILIAFRSPQAIIPFALAAWMVWMACSISFDYSAGKILEMPMICVSVQRGIKVQNRTRVVFRDQQEVPAYYEYFIPGRKVNMFTPNYVYIIYVRESNPSLMIGSQPL